jgi:crotonobetainyl-CoA:carnitine CoA-transferase CaiB-like acyl-CoA transferase
VAGEGRWGKLAARERDRTDVDAWVGRWTMSKPRAELIAICETFQVPCGPVASIAEIFEDEHYRARGNLAFIADPRSDTPVVVPDVVPRLSATPGGIDHLGPPLGADTGAVLTGLLGLSKSECDALAAKGVI